MDFFNLSNIIKKDPHKVFIVNYAPIFTRLNESEKNLIMQKSKVVEYAKGDIIYKQGNAPTAFYCVISGRIRVFIKPPDRAEEILEYLNCGRYFGMISSLLGENHSVSAQAANDSKILEITPEDFRGILNNAPRLAIDISHTLSRRLKKKDQAEKKIFESSIISVFGISADAECAAYVANLALSLKKETRKDVLLINVASAKDQLYRDLDTSTSLSINGERGRTIDSIDAAPSGSDGGLGMVKLDSPLPAEESLNSAIVEDAFSGVKLVNVIYNSSSLSYVSRFNAFLTYFTGSYHYIIVQLPPLVEDAVFNTLNQSDSIHLLTNCDTNSLRKTKSILFDLFQKVGSAQEKIRLILTRRRQDKESSYEETASFLKHSVYASLPALDEVYRKIGKPTKRIVTEHTELEYSRSVRRIAREIGGIRVGLALGSGAAYGLAHIGVIKVLEKENIQIDMIAGSSMGALVGALWASGLNSSEIESILMEYNNKRLKAYGLLVDLCFHKMSLAKGNKIRRFLEKHIGNKTFQDVRLPLRVVACNLTKRQEVIFNSGRIVDAVMASIAIPAVFAPRIINGDLIIDGGMIEPVAVGTLVKMGINKIIAVNVLPSPESVARSYEFKQLLKQKEREKAGKGSFLDKLSYQFQSGLNRMFFPNVFDIIVNSMQTMEYAIAEADCQRADVLISPVALGVEWFDFFRIEELIKIGEYEAVKSLANIKSMF